MYRGTLAMVVLAAVLAGVAYSQRPVEMAPPTFEDTGEPLFPEFDDPNAATYLEVKEYDEKAAQLTSFSVKLESSRGPLGDPQPQRLPGRRHRADGQGRGLVHRRQEGRRAQR